MRHTRDLLRRRLLMVEQRTAQLLSLQSMIARHTGKRLASSKMKQLQADELMNYFTDAASLFAARHALQLLQYISAQIEEIEDFVLAASKKDEHYAQLTSVPGIGKILGMTILLETGPIERFPVVGNYSSYARCVPSEKISNGKTKGRGNTKNGNRYLSMAFIQAAHYADTIKRYYQRKCKKVLLMVAKKTVANKLTRACFHMLKEGTAFDVKRVFG
jgi:transposase